VGEGRLPWDFDLGVEALHGTTYCELVVGTEVERSREEQYIGRIIQVLIGITGMSCFGCTFGANAG
jgi:hypothetical protein